MKLIVSAADYAMTEAITDGCIRAIREGILVDVGLMTNNFAYAKRGVEELKRYPHVCIGMDWNLVSGKSATDPKLIPSLVDENGIFLKSRVRRQPQFSEAPYEEFYLEMENQMKNFIALVGHTPAYILGHSWSSPNLVKAGYALAEKYGVPANLEQEHGFEAKYGLKRATANWYQAEGYVAPDGRTMDKLKFNDAELQRRVNVVDFLLEDRGELLKNEYSLFRCHCGYCDAELFEMSTFHVVRLKDMEALCSPKVKEWIAKNHVEVITMRQAIDEIEASRAGK